MTGSPLSSEPVRPARAFGATRLLPRRHGRRFGFRAGVLIVLALAGSFAVTASAAPRVVNGVATHADPAVGALLLDIGGNVGEAVTWCSGTLIGCETFLTAAHCVSTFPDPAVYFVYFQHAGFFEVASVAVPAGYHFPIADVAVLKLGAPVSGVTPAAINTIADPAAFGSMPGRIAGFGSTVGDGADIGIKRGGSVDTAPCQSIAGATDVELLCWNFREPLGDPGSNSNTCFGDSGGPLFIDFGGGEVVAGVTSGGLSRECLPDDHSWDANVYTYRDFITAQLGDDSTSACGVVPAVGDAEVAVVTHDGSLTWKDQNDRFIVQVPEASNELRITLNGSDDGSFDPDLYVKHGSAPTVSSYDCKSNGPRPNGYCGTYFPAAGDWYLLVNRASGAGDYQTTATIFGGDPPQCGNGVRELGERCDGSDAEACPGLCLLDCDCPEPVCGNGSREEGEQCDDGNLLGGDGCDADCELEACGNGVRQGEEECDDGNSSDFDECLSDCSLPQCGDGNIRAGVEECDDGNLDPGDGCDQVCLVEPVDVGAGGLFWGGFGEYGLDVFSFSSAGTGLFRADTNDGAGGCPAGADTVVELYRIDGGYLQVAYDDDGGIDRCSSLDLELEAGSYELVVYGWDGQAVESYAVDIQLRPYACGNGLLEEGESCDDGNTEAGDCCAADCSYEPAGGICAQDGEICTDRRCDGAGSCATTFNTAPCNDHVACTSQDACAAGICVGGPPPAHTCTVGGNCYACAQPIGTGNTPTAGDALFALKASVKLETCAPCICDVNASGAISTTDALTILQYAVGIAGVQLSCPAQ